VSVLLVTHNQAQYVRRALDSILAQEFDGGLEIVVGEDCSTDQTAAVVLEYAARAPDKFRVFQRPQNIGLAANLAGAWIECRGDYIALLEGDDYWTDPHKLRKQVAALDAQPGWVLCFHRVQVRSDTGGPPFLEPAEEDFPRETSIDDLLQRNYICNVSVMYRRGVVPEVPTAFRRLVHQDWPLHVWHARAGTIGYLPDVMGVWRHHPGSMWSSQPECRRWVWNFEFYDLMEELLGEEHRNLVRSARLDSVRRLCLDRDKVLNSRDYRWGRAILTPVRFILRRRRPRSQGSGPIP
jgi:glycosyltransferase involved in cell wall biosynthesis